MEQALIGLDHCNPGNPGNSLPSNFIRLPSFRTARTRTSFATEYASPRMAESASSFKLGT